MEGDDVLLAEKDVKVGPKRDEWMTKLPPERKPGVTTQTTQFSSRTSKDGCAWRNQYVDRYPFRKSSEGKDEVLTFGQQGEEVNLELILRVVADVGLIGLPNAGKSTLLAAITLGKPDIADYPFTTLMPNLGRLDGDPSLGAGKYFSEATLADLPGLIEGAHLGKGLGRNFLRHLRRTRLLVHVVDAAAENPIGDYRTVREELRMYNPEYLERPYVAVLN